MIPVSNFDQHARKFLEPELSMQNRHQLAIEVRDTIEIVHTSEYLNFLKSYFRVFSTLLTQHTKPQTTDSIEHKLRNVIIEILNRLPHSEVIKPFLQDLLKLLMHILTTDNEENGLICLRIIFDLHRSFRPALEPEVQPFLEFVCKIYQNFKATVNYFFEDANGSDNQIATTQHNLGYIGPQRPGGGGPNAGQLNPSTWSFKIVTECPLIVMFLFQLYPRYLQSNISILLPLMVTTISIPGPQQVPSNLRNQFTELKAAQVKTVSFLTYLLKSFAECIRPHEESISKSIVNLLVTCPDSVSIRKELLVATRHVLATEFRRGFFPLIDKILEERVLVGTGRACFETLRPLAYSILAELIHHVRLELKLVQLSRIVYLFSRNMHDSSLPLSVQTTCVRLMLNLAEPIFIRGVDIPSKEEGRALLGRILDAFVSKFGTLKHIVPQLLQGGEGEEGKERPSLRTRLELPIQTALNLHVPPEHAKEVTDCKQLIKSLVMGMKTLVWSITFVNAPPQAGQASGVVNSNGPKGMREDEVRLAMGILKSGIHCLALFKDKDEERDMFQHYSSVFAVMEPRNLMDMFSMCMPHLFECMINNNQLLQIFSTLLQTPKVVRHFADVLVNFLVASKLELLKQPDSPPAKLVLQLFRYLFVAVAKSQGDCERVLQPHITTLMETCIKCATEVEKPEGYMQLLRTMFLSLSSGKFELLFREFIPYLQPCLNMLLAMLEGPPGVEMIDLVVELCLIMPARLSSLLPHLPKLMKPLVLALKGSEELVGLGLRTLELWIDSLNPDFLEPSMAKVMSELILTLWTHLRPKPYPWGAKALQLLGKLGGRNRRFLKEPLALDCKENPEHGLRLILTFEPTTSFLVPLDRCIYLARTAVMQPQPGVESFYRKHALKFLRVCLCLVLNLKGNVGNDGVTSGQLSTMLLTPIDPLRRKAETLNMKADPGVKTKTQLMAEKTVFKILLMTVIAASAEPELQDAKDDFVPNICHHFAMIFHVDSLAAPAAPGQNSGGGSGAKPRSKSQTNLKELDPLIFLDALVAVLADENRSHAKAALNGLNIFAETLLLLARSKHTGVLTLKGVSTPGTPMMVSSPSMNPVYSPPPGVRIPVFEQLLPRLLHCCYGSTWQAQMGGVMGLGALVGKATVDTLCHFQVRAVRALVYVLKRLPQHANKEQEETSQVLTQVLRVANNVEESTNEPRRQSFQGVVDVLAAELFNPNATHIVRKNVQSCLALLASRTGMEVSELLEEPLHQTLLQPLITRPLRTKHPEQQVGTVMALNFCLALRPPLLKMTPELVNLLQEVLQIADTDESVLIGKFMNPKLAVTLTKLRTVCIELLCTAMAWADFKTPNHADLRSRIIAMFFKSLTCRTAEIVAVAKEGLRQVIQQQKMPKDLLQSSLRPILVNLAHTRSLTMPLLQGLARLLELLSNWFNVTLGCKLMEHLRKWLEPEKLSQSQKSWKAGEEPKIAAAIIELFHLLPNAAGKFLDELVTLTMQLETALLPGQIYSELNSPYRLPLTKFLNRYATEAVDYFLARLTQPGNFRRFMDIIRSEVGQPLREELAKSPEKIIATIATQNSLPAPTEDSSSTVLLNSSENSGVVAGADGFASKQASGNNAAETPELQFQGIALISALVKLLPDWLYNNRPVFDALVQVWHSPARLARLQNEQNLSLNQVKESKRLVKCFLNYLRHDNDEVGVLFDLLSIFLVRTRIDYTFLKEFYIIEVGEGYSPAKKKAVLVHFLQLFQNKELSQDHLVIAMQMLILPMLTHAFKNQNFDVVDQSIIKTIVEKLLDPPEEVSAEYDEQLRIELLQLATLLLKHMSNELVHHRKELIKFGWNHLKREESASKQWAFVNVCHFLEAYQAPEKIILQVFVALLRTCQPENRVLVRQALDVLMPALPKRLPLGEYKIPIWIRYTKKILLEEGHSVPNSIHIFQLLVRHSDLFYTCRGQFVPQMVNALSRLGLPPNTPPENRRLAIELAGLVVAWEKRRQAETKSTSDADGLNQVGDSNASGVSLGDNVSVQVGSKRSGETAGLPNTGDDISKRVKTENGLPSLSAMSPGIGTAGGAIPNIGTPGSGGLPDEEFKPNAAMEEMIINFLIRVALVTEPKDKEMAAMYKQALDLLSQALEVWPTANVKFHYLEKLLSTVQPAGQNKDPLLAVAQGLDVMNKIMEKQPHLFVRNNVQYIIQLLEPCFNSKLPDVGKSLCSLLKMVFDAFPVESANVPQEIRPIHAKVEELIQKHLATVTNIQPSLDTSTANAMIGFTWSIVKTLTEGQKRYIDWFLPALVRVIQRLMKEMLSVSNALSRQDHRSEQDAAANAARLMTEMGSVTTNLKALLKLVSSRVLLVPDCKRLFWQSLHAMLVEKGTDASVLLTIIDIIKDWIENDFKVSGTGTGPSALNVKDVITFLQKLSQVDKQNMSASVLEEWEGKYLKLLYRLCSDITRYNLTTRKDVFQNVECQFMLGLRARDPDIRQKFFTLYHESIGKTLFQRLQYIILQQEWEALSDIFWLKQGLDLLLAILVEQEPITLAPNSAQVPPLMASGGVPERSGVPQVIAETPEESDSSPPTFVTVANKHARFLNEMSKLQVADLVIPLRELAHTDANVAYHMWVLVFPIAWATLQKEEQVTLAKPMITLFSKEYHAKQQGKRPNVVQALLEGLSLSQPQPKIPSELIKFLGKTYNAWHIAISLLESHVILFPQETRCFDALAELYRAINEEDARFGLWKRRPITLETRAGLSLVQHGFWQRAQDVFYQAMSKATQGGYNNVSKAEMCLWEEQWIGCAKQLSQWDILAEFGKSVENYDILLDCLWKIPDWTTLKDTVLVKAQVEESPKLRILEAYVALHLGVLNDADKRVVQGIDLALHQWWQFPEMVVQSHFPLLQQFQQLVELQESGRVLLEITNGNKPLSTPQLPGVQSGAGNYIELKEILEIWRSRTPNEWDDLTVWYDLLQWRNHMYNAVINAFKDLSTSNPQLHQLGYRDKAWSVNKLAYVARKQGLHDVCVTVLNKMYGYLTMEVQEAFVKIREQAKAHLEMKGELISGLNLLNATNLDYFLSQDKAEIYRLRGEFMQKMGDSEDANQAFSNAISLFKHLPKGWISWGNYCDQVYQETGEELWLEYAVSCLLQGIKYGISNARSHLARVLYLLSFDTQNKTVGKAFERYGEQVPHWVWLSWIPQLLLSLQRPEASHCKAVLIKLAGVYPQALYCWLRTYLLERRDVAARGVNAAGRAQPATSTSSNANMSTGEGSSISASNNSQDNANGQTGSNTVTHEGVANSTQEERAPAGDNSGSDNIPGAGDQAITRRNMVSGWPGSAVSAFEAAKDIMEALRAKHPNLASELEVMLTEIGARFVPLPEERLLAVVHALLHRCYKYPTATTAEVPQSLKKELAGVCRACFSTDTVTKHQDFVQEYKKDFERDLDPESAATFPATLTDLTERLKHWKGVLQGNVEDRLPAVLKLEEESVQLREFHVLDIEVPGQYFNDQEVAPDHTVKLDRVGADVPIVRRHGSSHRRITMIGSDGSLSHFLVQTSLTPSARSDERMVQLFRVLNRLFDKNKESRRRHLAFNTPIIIPVWPQVRLVEDDPMYSTFGEVYEINCARYGREADLPITHFKDRLNQAITGQLSNEDIVDLRLHTYNEITQNYVTENVFSQYMYKTLPSCNHLWTFKKQFAVQLALSGFMSYMLQIGGRSPNKILFAKNTGKVFQNDFHPGYDGNGVVEFSEPVPFRLTRNLQTFFTPFFVEGLFVSSMCAAAQSIVAPKSQHMRYQLAMFFRDELVSWSWRRPPGMPAAPAAGGIGSAELKQRVTSNVDQVLTRIKNIAPQTFPEEDENTPDVLQSVQQGVTELVEAALRPKNLCMMDPTWHPWF